MSDKLISHIRKHRKPWATVVAIKLEDDSIGIGFSLCNKEDSFNKKEGVEVAVEKAKHGGPIPTCERTKRLITAEMEKMCDRASRYFKEAKIIRPCYEL